MTSMTLVRRLRARPAIVFAALTTAEGLAHWWGPDTGPVLVAESDARVGGRFRVRFRLVDGSEHEAAGEYLEVVDSKRVVLGWRWTFGGEPDERGRVSLVIIDLRPIDIGTEITFTHAQLHTELSCNSHRAGWAGALDKLERYLSFEVERVPVQGLVRSDS
jgi:uncharacterized protein YndB with AHSA1/START domain